MKKTLAFDVYGTLIDPMGIVTALGELVGDEAPGVAARWREKQLEYLFRRGLGRKYQPFSVCTRQALEYVCAAGGLDIGEAEKDRLMALYRNLPPYPGARETLERLAAKDFACYAFSNGEPGDLSALLANAGLDEPLTGIVSVVEVRSYKPDPAVYGHFLENTGAMLGETWLVSSNPFDVIGAMEVGWKSAWVRRSPDQVFDPWGVQPTIVVSELPELVDVLA